MRRPFLLLELLIAITLLSICMSPLLLEPLARMRAEVQIIEDIELQRIAEYLFSEIQTKLYRKEIQVAVGSSVKGQLKDVSIQLPSKVKTYTPSYCIKPRKQKEETLLLTKVTITFEKNKCFTYEIYHEKTPLFSY